MYVKQQILYKERLKEAEALIEKGLSPVELPKKLGVSKPQAYQYLRALNKSPGRLVGCWTDENTDLLVALWGQRAPIKDIKAQIPGSTYDGIRSKARRLGLEPYYKRTA